MSSRLGNYKTSYLETASLSDNYLLYDNMTSLSTSRQISKGSTITRAVLSKIIQQKFKHLSFNQARSLVDDMFSIISEEIVAQRQVILREFGSFRVRKKRERPGRDPRTGAYASICARKVILFKPSKVMTKRISSQISNAKISNPSKYNKQKKKHYDYNSMNSVGDQT